MTETEKKALALLNEAGWKGAYLKRAWNCRYEALCRAIEAHEAFRQEVSEAVENYCGYVPPDSPCHPITRFIITKPDPLVEAWLEAFPGNHIDDAREECAKISAALAKHGLKLERIEHE